MTTRHGPHILMCRPEHFGVLYTINPWMNPDEWERDEQVLAQTSQSQWTALYRTLRGLGAHIELVPPEEGVPDLVFTANAALVMDRKALLAHFRHPQRQAEEEHLAAAFRGLRTRRLIDEIVTLPHNTTLEGAGDCVFDRTRNLFWMGYGPRSDVAAADVVRNVFGLETIALELTDPRFYHMDTALSALPRGEIMVVPDAFNAEGRAIIAARVPAVQRIAVGGHDAAQLCANAIAIGDNLVMSSCSDRLRDELAERGYRVVTTPLTAFLRSGGSAFCLTLRLDLASARASASAPAEAIAIPR